jgi:flagellar protein FlaG
MEIGPIKSSALSVVQAQKDVRLSAADPSAPSKVSREEPQRVERSEAPREISREEVEDAVAVIQEFVQSVRRNVNFSLDEASERVVVKVTDGESGDVIRQIPSEEALKLAENLSEVRSLLFKAEA